MSYNILEPGQTDESSLGELSSAIMKIQRERPDLKSRLKRTLINAVQEM
jgi:hypothetical protein